MVEVSPVFPLHTVQRECSSPPSYAGWTFYTYSHFYLMVLPSFQITLSTLASTWFMGPQQKQMDYTANEWIKQNQEAGSYDQRRGRSFLNGSLRLIIARFRRARTQTDSALFKKTMEFFSTALPSPASLHSDVSISMSCDRCKNCSLTAYIRLRQKVVPLSYSSGTLHSVQDTWLGKYPGLWNFICSSFAPLGLTSAWTSKRAANKTYPKAWPGKGGMPADSRNCRLLPKTAFQQLSLIKLCLKKLFQHPK